MLNMCPNIDIDVPTVTILMQPQQLSCGQGIMGWGVGGVQGCKKVKI